MNIDEYKNKIARLKEKIDIIKLKQTFSLSLKNEIKINNINIPDIADDLGMTDNNVLNILTNQNSVKGSELLLIAESIERLKTKDNSRVK